VANFEDAYRFLNGLRNKLDKMAYLLAPFARVLMDKRIFDEGRGSNGEKMPPYSTKEARFPREKFARKSAFDRLADEGDRTIVLERGYEEFRKIQGRRVDIRNVRFTGDMQKSFVALVSDDGLKTELGFTSEKEALKAAGNEKSAKMIIFDLSEDELDKCLEFVNEEVSK